MRVPSTVALMTGLLLLVPSPVAGAQEPIITPDSTYSIVLPGDFHPIQINPAAQLQFGNLERDSYFMSLSESKEDLYGWNLTRHSMITFSRILTATDFPEVSTPRDIVLGGFPGRQYEMRGVSQGIQLGYLHTVVELPTAFVQLLLWTKRSQWDEEATAFQGVLDSFRVLSQDAASADPFAIVPGTWVWETNESGCESTTQTFTIAANGKEMTIEHSEPFERPDGEMTDLTEYVIEGSGPRVLHTFIPNETRLTATGVPVKWDLVVVARNRLAWHRTDWVEGNLTGMLMRCEDGA